MEIRSKSASSKSTNPDKSKSGVGKPRIPSPDRASRRPVIGWREWISLPGLLDLPIKAKIDTGARTSAIHAFHITRIRVDGEPWVEFGVHPVQRQRHPEVRCRARLLDQRMVISSSGHKQLRYVVRTMAAIGDIRWPIELSLTDRDEMGFRMLLGREAVRRRFLVDPAGSFRLSGHKPDTTTHGEEPVP